MILSISNIAWNPDRRHEIYSMLQKYHITGLEIAPGLLFYDADDPFNPNKLEIRRVISELERFNLKIISMQSLLYMKTNAQLFGSLKQKKIFFNEMVTAIKLAEKLNIPNLVFGSPLNRNYSNNITPEIAHDIALDTFQKLGLIASEAGTSILIEPNPKEYKTNFINSMLEAIIFVKELQSPGVKSILDIGSIKMNNEYSNLSGLIAQSIHYLKHVHISEPFLKPAPFCSHEFKSLYNLLQNFGYTNALSIEMKPVDNDIITIERSVSLVSKVNTQYENKEQK